MGDFCPTTEKQCAYRHVVDEIADGLKIVRGKKKPIVEKIDRTIAVAQQLCEDNVCGIALLATGMSFIEYASDDRKQVNLIEGI
jgi:hypothetical protein